jgi:hypothetical protein
VASGYVIRLHAIGDERSADGWSRSKRMVKLVVGRGVYGEFVMVSMSY